MKDITIRGIRGRAAAVAALAAAAALGIAACGSSGSPAAGSGKPLSIAYLSFAVQNSYDEPMLAAAQAVASRYHAAVKVFDANNSEERQYSQLQSVISSGRYTGVILQPIFGTGLSNLVAKAIAKGIKVVNVDQILGQNLSTAEPQVKGLSANITFVPTRIGTQLGDLVIQACRSKNLRQCNVGYLYDVKTSALDVAINEAFTKAIAADPGVRVVANGQDLFDPTTGLKAVLNMLRANPHINLIVGSDQGIEGGLQALDTAGLIGRVMVVGYGASAAALAAIASGAWYADVAQAPATEGRLAMQAVIAAIRTGKVSGAINPVAGLPDNGIVTKQDVKSFTAQWPG